MTESFDTRRLEALCATEEARGVWLDALHAVRGDVAAATGGQNLVVDIEVVGVCRTRVAVLGNGVVVCPFSGRDEADVLVTGTAEQVLPMLLYDRPLIEAQLEGLVVIVRRSADTDTVGRLRRVVGRTLRGVIRGALAVLPWRRWMAARRGQRFSAGSTALAERTVAALVASAVVVGSVGFPGSICVNAATGSTDVKRVTSALARSTEEGTDTLPRRVAAAPSGAVQAGSARPSRPVGTGPRPSLTAGLQRDESLHAAVSAETPGDGSSETNADLSCRPPVRSLTCTVLDQASQVTPIPAGAGE